MREPGDDVTYSLTHRRTQPFIVKDGLQRPLLDELSSSGPGPGQVPGQVQKVQGLRIIEGDLKGD